MEQPLDRLVEELTTSGAPQLDPRKMKALKKICKSSEEQLSRAHHLLRAQLGREHAQVRLAAFQALEQLFARSHRFRLLVVAGLQELLALTLGTDLRQPLPPPREAARRLRQAALRALGGWARRYGAAYKELALGCAFLQRREQVDFQDADARTVAERKRAEQKQRRLDGIYRARAKRAAREMEEMSAEIRRCLTELDSCFRLLVPFDLAPGPAAVPTVPAGGAPELCAEEQPCCSKSLPACAPREGPGPEDDGEDAGGAQDAAAEDDDEDDDDERREEDDDDAAEDDEGREDEDAEDEEDEEDEDEDAEAERGELAGFLRCHGLGSRAYSLQLDLSADSLKVREDEDNSAVVQSARDALKLVHNKFLPAARAWVQLFGRMGAQGGLLARAVDLKAAMEQAVRRGRELAVEPQGAGQPAASGAAGDEGDEDEDDDFVEVPEKEGYEARIPDHLRRECGLEDTPAPQGWPASGTESDDGEARAPASAAARPSSPAGTPEGQEATARQAAERARAPVVPFGGDLCFWGRELPAGKLLQSESQHRFWKPSEVDTEADGGSAAPWTRHIPFPGTFEPVRHRCRAPRPDGRLCARQDRLKCPFHGKIVPRDDAGRPLSAEDRAREQRRREQGPAGQPAWRDPAFLRDVEAATGVDLGSSLAGRGGGRRRRHPGLVDLRQQADSSRARLAKKVFAKAAVRRAAAAMSRVDRKKHEKFANQFNYALS